MTYHIFSHSFTSGLDGGDPLKLSKTGPWAMRRGSVRHEGRQSNGSSVCETCSGAESSRCEASGRGHSTPPPRSTVTSSSRLQVRGIDEQGALRRQHRPRDRGARASWSLRSSGNEIVRGKFHLKLICRMHYYFSFHSTNNVGATNACHSHQI